VTVAQAHKLLIASAIAFALFYAVFELRHWSRSGEPMPLLLSALALAVGVALLVYLRRFARSLDTPGHLSRGSALRNSRK
jgi:hypothetical protein